MADVGLRANELAGWRWSRSIGTWPVWQDPPTMSHPRRRTPAGGTRVSMSAATSSAISRSDDASRWSLRPKPGARSGSAGRRPRQAVESGEPRHLSIPDPAVRASLVQEHDGRGFRSAGLVHAHLARRASPRGDATAGASSDPRRVHPRSSPRLLGARRRAQRPVALSAGLVPRTSCSFGPAGRTETATSTKPAPSISRRASASLHCH